MASNTFFSYSLLLCTIFLSLNLPAQETVRLHAGFSIKQTDGDKGQLVTGQVFFDKKIQKLCYKIDFPEHGFWVQKDTLSYEFGVDTHLVKITTTAFNPAFSVFQLILNDDFDDLGLKKLGFKPANIEKIDSTVIVEWAPDKKWEKKLGKVLISSIHKKINAVVYFSPSGEVLSKEQYNKPVLMAGRWIPTQIISVIPTNNGKDKIKITTLRNIKINEPTDDFFYDFPLPAVDTTPK
jgi:hypothetical protein